MNDKFKDGIDALAKESRTVGYRSQGLATRKPTRTAVKDAVNHFAESVKRLSGKGPTSEGLTPERKWISVDDRLPEKDTRIWLRGVSRDDGIVRFFTDNPFHKSSGFNENIITIIGPLWECEHWLHCSEGMSHNNHHNYRQRASEKNTYVSMYHFTHWCERIVDTPPEFKSHLS